MDSSLNIVQLIERSPITRLSGEYQHRFIRKIKDTFTEEQQHLFVSSFYCYLNHHSTNDFVIDLDNVWQWLGFNAKQNAKLLLDKHFVHDRDYRLLIQQHKQKTDSRGGHNKQTILLNIRTFKLLCLKAGTQKANEIHEYYIRLEETLQEVLNEETSELRLQLQQTSTQLQQEIQKAASEKDRLREKTILEQFPDNTECVYYGYIENTNDKKEKLIKYGQSNCLRKRVIQHKRTFLDFRLVNAFRVSNKQLIENDIKTHHDLQPFRRNLVIHDANHTELLALNCICITELDTIIHNIISSHELNHENFVKLLKENGKYKEENLFLKEENEKLHIAQKKLSKKLYKADHELQSVKATLFKLSDSTSTLTNQLISHTDVTSNEESYEPTSTTITYVDDFNDVLLNSKRITKAKDGFYHLFGKTYPKLFGTRTDVWNETAYKTAGDLTKNDLMVNRYGKIVSKKKFVTSKHEERLADFNMSRKNKSILRKGLSTCSSTE